MTQIHPVPTRVWEGSPNPITDMASYRETYDRARADPGAFWLGITQERIAWRRPPTIGLEGSFYDIAEGPIRWFSDGQLNITESCLDRHLENRGDIFRQSSPIST